MRWLRPAVCLGIFATLLAWGTSTAGSQHAYDALYLGLTYFFQGNARNIQEVPAAIVPFAFACITIDFPICLLCGFLAKREAIRRQAELAAEKLENPWLGTIPGHLFSILILCPTEEFIFRWLPLGWIANLPPFRSTLAFYALFGLSTVGFFLPHLFNITRQSRWAWPYMFVQLACGNVVLTCALLQTGYAGAVTTHLLHNILLFLISRQAWGVEQRSLIALARAIF